MPISMRSGIKELETDEIAFTGGEPFMNPDMMQMLEVTLATRLPGSCVDQCDEADAASRGVSSENSKYWFDDKLVIRVSVDHYTQQLHERERGPGSWQPMLDGLIWLSRNKFQFRYWRPHAVGRGRGVHAPGLCHVVCRTRYFWSMPTILQSWSCSRKWMPIRTCPRSPTSAGRSSVSTPVR